MTATVIPLAERRKRIEPNRKVYEHGGQKYTILFDFNAPKDKPWVWVVDYVHVSRLVGTATTLEEASVKARKEIHQLNRLYGKLEEDDLAGS